MSSVHYEESEEEANIWHAIAYFMLNLHTGLKKRYAQSAMHEIQTYGWKWRPAVTLYCGSSNKAQTP